MLQNDKLSTDNHCLNKKIHFISFHEGLLSIAAPVLSTVEFGIEKSLVDMIVNYEETPVNK